MSENAAAIRKLMIERILASFSYKDANDRKWFEAFLKKKTTNNLAEDYFERFYGKGARRGYNG